MKEGTSNSRTLVGTRTRTGTTKKMKVTLTLEKEKRHNVAHSPYQNNGSNGSHNENDMDCRMNEMERSLEDVSKIEGIRVQSNEKETPDQLEEASLLRDMSDQWTAVEAQHKDEHASVVSTSHSTFMNSIASCNTNANANVHTSPASINNGNKRKNDNPGNNDNTGNNGNSVNNGKNSNGAIMTTKKTGGGEAQQTGLGSSLGTASLDDLVSVSDIQAMRSQAEITAAAASFQKAIYAQSLSSSQLSLEAAFKKRGRTVLTPLQTRILSQVLEKTWFPSSDTRLQLASLLNVPERTVQIWFQNQRQKAKQHSTRGSPADRSPYDYSFSGVHYGPIGTLGSVSPAASSQNLSTFKYAGQYPFAPLAGPGRAALTPVPTSTSSVRPVASRTMASSASSLNPLLAAASSQVRFATPLGAFQGLGPIIHTKPPSTSTTAMASTSNDGAVAPRLLPKQGALLAGDGLDRLYEATMMLTSFSAANAGPSVVSGVTLKSGSSSLEDLVNAATTSSTVVTAHAAPCSNVTISSASSKVFSEPNTNVDLLATTGKGTLPSVVSSLSFTSPPQDSALAILEHTMPAESPVPRPA